MGDGSTRLDRWKDLMGKVSKKAAKAGKAGPGAARELGWENKKEKGETKKRELEAALNQNKS
jgi:hypothetical protein